MKVDISFSPNFPELFAFELESTPSVGDNLIIDIAGEPTMFEITSVEVAADGKIHVRTEYTCSLKASDKHMNDQHYLRMRAFWGKNCVKILSIVNVASMVISGIVTFHFLAHSKR